MTGGRGLRIALAGATGALAREVLAVLEARSFPVSELRAFATERSTGDVVSFAGEEIGVDSGAPRLAGLDLVIVCTPAGPALELVRESLRAEVCCIDCSGALSTSPDVPLLVSGLCPPSAVIGAPVITAPANPALPWSLVLSALDRVAGLERVVGTVLQSASHAGRAGIAALSAETLALLGQREGPEPDVFPAPVAFDCVPQIGPLCSDGGGGQGGATRLEEAIARDLQRLLRTDERPSLPVAVTAVQIPTFVGDGSALAVQLSRPLAPEEAAEAFAKAPGVAVWTGDEVGPSTRDAAGCDVALVGRLRADASTDRGLQLWCAVDPLRLAAANAVKLAETRLRLH